MKRVQGYLVLTTLALCACGGGGVDGATNKVATVTSPAGPVIATVSQGRIGDMQSIAPPANAPETFSYPAGFLSIDVEDLAPGATVILTLELPEGIAPTTYVKCDGWDRCVVFPGASFSGNVVTLTLVDGGAGDKDGVADGVIHDPGAPALLAATGDDGSDDSDDGDAGNGDGDDDDVGDGSGDGGDGGDVITDADGDGVLDAVDNCAVVANPGQTDADWDTVGDTCDPTPPGADSLLGDLKANGGRNYAAVYCEGKPDGAALPRDPRELIAGSNLENSAYAVWFNDPFELCETPELFANQRKQNELLGFDEDDPDRVYTAKPRPKTCGEWRTAVENGRQYIMSNAITGEVLTRDSLYNLIKSAQAGFPQVADYPDGLPTGEFPASAAEANTLIAKISQQRYGWPAHPYANPFPMPGEDPNATDGGSLQLPIALVQTKAADGKWSGKIGVTCFACHIGQIGRGEVVGNSATRDGHAELYGGSASGAFVSLNGSNTDTGLSLYDMQMANGTFGFGPNDFGTPLNQPGYMANRTRGTNAADQEIVNVLIGRDLDTLNWRGEVPYAEVLGRLAPSTPLAGGDQDMPTWWWTHNKSRYLWVGFGSAGSSRGNFFPSSTNPNDGHWSKQREGDYQDLDMWLNAVEAPRFVGPAVNTALAQAGAILFHEKDLWANTADTGKPDYNDIPKPPGGNGSCAGCHGAYSPMYINKPGFLPDPGLAGMAGYTVPLNILRTDPAQSDLFTLGSYEGTSNPAGAQGVGGALADSWFSYPDALAGYKMPEQKAPAGTEGIPLDRVIEASDDFGPGNGSCEVRTLGGYTAQPLHGVWASGPYFHNGSVPTVWDVLKPADRPAVWRRQLVPEGEAAPATGDRGFDTDLARAYDYDKLGWKYEVLACDARTDGSAVSCTIQENVPTVSDFLLMPFKVIADYFSPPYVADPKSGTVAQRAIYNTHAYSKDNHGHEFTRVLTDAERRALVEYLKTL